MDTIIQNQSINSINFFLGNDDFYPTPKELAAKMIAKIKDYPIDILEPSAGKGDLINAIKEHYQYHFMRIAAMEIDPTLQATLHGKDIKLIDTDFLSYSGPDKFDLIIANPPFNEGDKHLLKAIDVLYRGQIIFLLNAETLRNPCTRTRQELIKKLNELNAEIEYIQGAFLSAERPTGVEIALISIIVEKNIEDDLFAGADDTVRHERPDIEDKGELSTGQTVEELVAEYNQILQIGMDTITAYYRNYKKIGNYLRLNEKLDIYSTQSGDITAKMQYQFNELIGSLRIAFWRRTMDLKEVSDRLTIKKRAEFEDQLKRRCDMDFTANNIRQFVINLIGGYEKTLTEAVLDIFDKFTRKHSWHEGNVHEKNIHYYNGWKTNKAFKVNQKIVLPVHAGYGEGPFRQWGKWNLNYQAIGQLNDIDKVMNYFDGMRSYQLMSEAIKQAFEKGQSAKIENTYFIATCHKKGTIHLTFKDEDILRRFNVIASKDKNWLPCDYGNKIYSDLSEEEKAVVISFEGEKSYSKNRDKGLFLNAYELLQLNA